MTSPDKMAAGGSDVTQPTSTSQSGNVGRERPEMKRSADGQLMAACASDAPTASPSIFSSSCISAGNDDRHGGNGSRNPVPCGWLQSIGRLRRKLEDIRPLSTSKTLSRARTVDPMSNRSSCAAVTDSRTPVTIAAGSYSTHLRNVAAAHGNSRFTAESTADHSSSASPSAVPDCRSNTRPVHRQTLPVQGLVTSLATFPGRSRHDVAPEVRPTSTSNSHLTQLQTAKNTNLSKHQPVPGRSSSDWTAIRTPVSSATMDSYSTSACHIATAGDGQNQSVFVNFGSRASASPQLRRWECHPESGSQSSTATQVGGIDHHPEQFHHQKLDQATKPHSVPCSPRLQARLAATQPWRPWSPSKSDEVVAGSVQTIGSGSGRTDSRTSMNISQLASSLLLTKVIRDHQELKSRGNYNLCFYAIWGNKMCKFVPFSCYLSVFRFFVKMRVYILTLNLLLTYTLAFIIVKNNNKKYYKQTMYCVKQNSNIG